MLQSVDHQGNRLNKIFDWAETIFHYVAGIVLMIAAAFSLFFVAQSVFHFFSSTDQMSTLVEIIDRVMLFLMVIEILYTIHTSIQQHRLCAEPFLVVGLIAAIRRILIISVESGHIVASEPEVFRNLLT